MVNSDAKPSRYNRLVDNMSEMNSSELKMVSIMVFLGFIMTLGMIITTILYPGGGQFHEPMDSADIYAQLAATSLPERDIMLSGIVFDTFFILGYVSLFYGIFLLVKNQVSFFPKIGLILGFATAVCDLLENALHIAFITGSFNGWTPDPLLWVYLWTFTFVKDLTSYMAGFTFMVLLLVTLSSPVTLRMTKLIFALFFGVYVLIGSVGVIYPSFLIIRNLGFVVDLAIGAILFYRAAKLDIAVSQQM